MTSWIVDTHAVVWHATDPRRLGKAVHLALSGCDRGRSLCYIPLVVLAEVTLLHERGRLRIGAAQLLDRIAGNPGYAVLAADVVQALEFAALPGITDPWDRFILAAARATGSRLLSADTALDGYGVERVWD